MRKRVTALILCFIILTSTSCQFNAPHSASMPDVKNPYVLQLLFGNNALQYESNEKVQMLLSALYLCCEQYEENGQIQLNYLKANRVKQLPALRNLSVPQVDLVKCSCTGWDHSEYDGVESNAKIRSARKKALVNTVAKILESDKNGIDSNQLAKLLYYLELLAVYYISDDPQETEVSYGNYSIPAYSGDRYRILSNDVPSFTEEEKIDTQLEPQYSQLDRLDRSGVAFAVAHTFYPRNTGENLPDPAGWNQRYYFGITQHLYDRSHLIAHQFSGRDDKRNLFTGTVYLNQASKDGMYSIEEAVSKHIRNTDHHVLYRVTPVYKGDNLIASGVQIEIYCIEDAGDFQFNRYYYNVQPGVKIDYRNGSSEVKDRLVGDSWALPFAMADADERTPDFLFELMKSFDELFQNQGTSGAFASLKNEMGTIANIARGQRTQNDYLAMKKCEYDCLNLLTLYMPDLLRKIGFTDALLQQE